MSQQILRSRNAITATVSPMSTLNAVICKLDGILKYYTAWAVVVSIAAMVISIWISVFTRYVMGDAIPWGEQVAKYLMIWAAMIGSSLAVREGAHIAVTIVVDRFPPMLAKICSVTAFILSGVFLIVAVYYGYFWAAGASIQTDPSVWDMPLSIPYFAIPVGSALMLLQLMLTLVIFLEKYEDY